MDGNWVREARKRLGLTQMELALMLGYRGGAGVISDIENDRQTIGGGARRLLQAYLDGYRPHDWLGSPAPPKRKRRRN